MKGTIFFTLNEVVFALILLLTSILISCSEPEEKINSDCYGENSPCPQGFSLTIVKKGTFENLIGLDSQLIHPDSIIILNMDSIQMYKRVHDFADWWVIDGFTPYQELHCFNQCTLDSAFSRFYYIYIGNEDWDTLEVHFPARTKFATYLEVYFNGFDATEPKNAPVSISYWLQKEY